MSSDRPTFAAAVTCIDGRVHEPVIAWVRERFPKRWRCVRGWRWTARVS